MKRLATILSVCSSLAIAHAQKAPILQSKVGADRTLTLTWPVDVITNASTNLHASYQLEVAAELGVWTAQGTLLRGENFPTRLATAKVENSITSPASFFRVRTVFDFTGGSFAERIIQDAPLTGSVFFGANFFAAQLDGSSFDNADLAAADFRFASMTSVTAANADFTLARLSDANLTSANLAGANLLLAELSGADLTFADLSGADIRGAIVQDCNLTYTRLHNTTVDSKTIFDRRGLAIWLIVNGQATNRTFTDIDLTFTDLSGANLTKAKLAGLDLSGVDFVNADLSGADLSNTTLRLLDLRGTTITPSTIIASKWRLIWDIVNNPKADRSHPNTDLSLAFWIGSTFERADVHGSDFTRGIMSEVNLEGANAVGARFPFVEFHDVNFKNADLRNASFSNALLDNVNFLGANITNANFTGATFRNTTMPDGSIRN